MGTVLQFLDSLSWTQVYSQRDSLSTRSVTEPPLALVQESYSMDVHISVCVCARACKCAPNTAAYMSFKDTDNLACNRISIILSKGEV